jgi:flagellar basal-body rod modification protein FlgD
MDISPISTGTQAASTATLTADFNMFLRLLTTQLQYQDPLDPMDTSEYTQQLVSYSQVEQAIQQTSRLDAILARLSVQDLAAASSYIGREVTAYQPTATLGTGGAEWFYDLQSTAATARVAIVDRNGQVVRTLDGATTAGRHHIAWDGTDATGRALPPGDYTLRVEALTASGQAVQARVGTTGIVSGVEQLAGAIILNLGATRVRAVDIAAIAASPLAQ